MSKYRKKPVIIEAFEYDGDLINSQGAFYIPDWAQKAYKENILYFKSENDNPPELFIKTLEGNMKVSEGDYVIQGVNGELYPCKPDIFKKTYEPVIDFQTHEVLVEKTVDSINNIKRLNN